MHDVAAIFASPLLDWAQKTNSPASLAPLPRQAAIRCCRSPALQRPEPVLEDVVGLEQLGLEQLGVDALALVGGGPPAQHPRQGAWIESFRPFRSVITPSASVC